MCITVLMAGFNFTILKENKIYITTFFVKCGRKFGIITGVNYSPVLTLCVSGCIS